MLGPRKDPTFRHPGDTSAPAKGRTPLVYAYQRIRAILFSGTPNSRYVRRPPGLSTLTTSRSVASGSAT